MSKLQHQVMLPLAATVNLFRTLLQQQFVQHTLSTENTCKTLQYTAAHEVRMKLALRASVLLKTAEAATLGLLQLLTPQQQDPLKHEHNNIVASLNVASLNVSSATVLPSATDLLPPVASAPAPALQDAEASTTSGTKAGTPSLCLTTDSDVGEGVDYDPVLEALFDGVADSIPICDDPSVLQELAAAAAEQRMQMAPNVVVDLQPLLAMPQGASPVFDQTTIAHSITTGQF
jgi:hypothetical protein